VLQYVAVCCSVLQCVAVRCSVLQCVAVRCSAFHCVAVRCSVWQCAATDSLHALWTTQCNTLQHPATHCNIPPHTQLQHQEDGLSSELQRAREHAEREVERVEREKQEAVRELARVKDSVQV